MISSRIEATTPAPIYLTFDDGPLEPYTSQILDILQQHNVKASFFVCGKNIERFPVITKKIVEAGHIIGNHSYSHSFVLSFLGILNKEIEKTDAIIRNITQIETKFFRSPWGFLKFRFWLIQYLKKNNYKFIPWDFDSRDWFNPKAQNIIKRVLKSIKPGQIILLHDGYEGRFNGDRSQTVLALPVLIKELKKSGYNFETIDKLK